MANISMKSCRNFCLEIWFVQVSEVIYQFNQRSKIYKDMISICNDKRKIKWMSVFHLIVITFSNWNCSVFKSHLYFRDLTLLQERQHKKCEKLETAVQEDEALFFQEMYTLMEQNKVFILILTKIHIFKVICFILKNLLITKVCINLSDLETWIFFHFLMITMDLAIAIRENFTYTNTT